MTLQVATQKGVDFTFTSDDMTLDLEDFTERILEPAMSVLAANIENDALSMYKDVANIVDNDANAISMYNILQGKQALDENLAPMDNQRSALLSPYHSAKLVDALKGLFHDGDAVEQQYREGKMGKTGGFTFYQNSMVSKHTTGTAAKTTGYTVNGAGQTGATIVVQTGTTTFLKGDVVTFAGCNDVHPETKVSTGVLKKFVITADYAGGAGSLAISPSIVTSGATQNCSGSPTNTGAVVKVGAGASELLDQSMVYHKNAFTFATADLVLPSGVDFAAREVMDGISMRVVRQYAISTDTFPCRLDVLYGYKTIRQSLACRIHADG